MRRNFVLGLALLCACFAQSQELPANPSGITLRRMLSYPLLQGVAPAGASMSPDGTKIIFSWNRTGERVRDAWVVDFPNGEPKEIIKSNSIQRFPREDDKRTELEKTEEIQYDGGIGGYIWSPDSQEVLFQYRGRTWLMAPDGTKLRPLFDTRDQVSSPSYSPDGQYILFNRGGNLYRYHRKTHELKQLTFVGNPGVSLGDYSVSPDSSMIAVEWSDSSRVGRHSMMDFSKDRAEVVPITRGWIGEMGVNVQIGLVPMDGGLIKFVAGLPRYMWTTGMEWSPNSRQVAIARISQDFQKFNLTTIDAKTAKKFETYEEKAPKNYIPDFRMIQWSRDSKKILFTTDISGGKFINRSLFAISPYETVPTPVYSTTHDIAAFTRPKNSDRIFLVAHTETPLETEVLMIEPDGTTWKRKPLPGGISVSDQFDYSSAPMVSDDGKSVASMASNPQTPAELYALWPESRKITDSPTKDFQKIRLASSRQISFKAEDGATIYGQLITPPNFDPKKKYPAVISNMYANSARAGWLGTVDHYTAAELGIVVLKVNFRGSWGQGGEFNSGYAKQMGVIDSAEAKSAKEFLVSTGFVNPDRCGIWGWSYGGFLTLMIMTQQPGVFDTGVAVASVTDWKSYNEWYVRRRLGLPSEDKETFERTSPIHHTKKFQGNLLTVHGMLDDNVLYQDIVRFRQNMIRDGKFFDSLDYPRGNHGMFRDEERPHVYESILRYLNTKLKR